MDTKPLTRELILSELDVLLDADREVLSELDRIASTHDVRCAITAIHQHLEHSAADLAITHFRSWYRAVIASGAALTTGPMSAELVARLIIRYATGCPPIPAIAEPVAFAPDDGAAAHRFHLVGRHSRGRLWAPVGLVTWVTTGRCEVRDDRAA